MRIDCQTHIFPRAYAEFLARNRGFVRAVLHADRCELAFGEAQKFVLEAEAYSVERKLRDMDAAEVDVSVLSVNMPGPESPAGTAGVGCTSLSLNLSP